MFYIYHQNNSSGYFIQNEKVDLCVIIEALSQESANTIAEKELGMYFDGVRKGMDCPCCGDRWIRAYTEKRTLEEYKYYPEETKIYRLDCSDLK